MGGTSCDTRSGDVSWCFGSSRWHRLAAPFPRSPLNPESFPRSCLGKRVGEINFARRSTCGSALFLFPRLISSLSLLFLDFGPLPLGYVVCANRSQIELAPLGI